MSNGQPQRSSIFAGLLLIVLGAIFLLNRFDPALGLGHLIRLYWPLLIILWGVAKLIDCFAARKAGQARPPILSGGEAALLILLAIVLSGFVFHDWIRGHYPDAEIELSPFHESFSQTREIAPQTIPAGSHVMIELFRGSIAVHAVEGSELRASVNESAAAANQSDANAKMDEVEVVIERAGDGYSIHPSRHGDFHESVSLDLDVHVPKTSSVTAHTAHGDISIGGIAGRIDARTESGDIEVHDSGSDVTATLQKGDAQIAKVAGNVRVSGRGGDVDVGDVAGDVSVDGPFLGSTRARKVGGTTRCHSPWADLTVAQMTGRLELDSSQIDLSDAAGAAKLLTHNKDIDVENVAGRIEIADSHADVKVGYAAPPREDLVITNESGEVKVTLPAKSSFQVSAVSRSGVVESDFNDPLLETANENDMGRLNGQFGAKSGAPGPKITITTSYGTIQLRKSS
ncbi:MAG TPA: DUF4097 family beta strand repeat-containing protein [Candidatus Acidoferrales bacterium]|nr:DUF4097 family beta strand repeat-containing protein [Candidatus Acidoferrales bacterium]